LLFSKPSAVDDALDAISWPLRLILRRMLGEVMPHNATRRERGWDVKMTEREYSGVINIQWMMWV
jgi:hypothetical protein